jgi:hypothetical protein
MMKKIVKRIVRVVTALIGVAIYLHTFGILFYIKMHSLKLNEWGILTTYWQELLVCLILMILGATLIVISTLQREK